MGSQLIIAEITDQNVPLPLNVNRGGGVPGLTAVVSVIDPVSGEWLDFDDGTFKAFGATTTPKAPMAEVDAVNAPGDYILGLDVSAITNLPAGGAAGVNHFLGRYEFSGAVVGTGQDLLEIRSSAHAIESEAAAAARAATNTAEHVTILADVGLSESEIAAAAREATNTAEHALTLSTGGPGPWTSAVGGLLSEATPAVEDAIDDVVGVDAIDDEVLGIDTIDE